jgi:hypothetical protein
MNYPAMVRPGQRLPARWAPGPAHHPLMCWVVIEQHVRLKGLSTPSVGDPGEFGGSREDDPHDPD